MRPLRLWQKLWVLFTVIWVVVSGLNAGTILAFSEGAEQDKAMRPIILGVVVPLVLYGVGFFWELLRRRRGGGE